MFVCFNTTGQGQRTQEAVGRCRGTFSIQRRSERFGKITFSVTIDYSSCMPPSLGSRNNFCG